MGSINPLILSLIKAKKGKKEEDDITKNMKEVELPEKIEENISLKDIEKVLEKKDTEKKYFRTTYPVILSKLDDKLITIVYVSIFYDIEKESFVYYAIEPEISEEDQKIVEETIDLLEKKIDIPLNQMSNVQEAYNYLDKLINEIWDFLEISYDREYALKVKYYIFRDTIGYGKIEPLMRDPNIEDISCDGVNVPVFVFHRNPILGNIPTNIVFTSDEELDEFAIKLSQKAGKIVSLANPLLDAALPDGSRLQITFSRQISAKGTNFTIRKFSKEPLTPIHLIKFGSINEILMAYLWFLIENRQSMLVSGGTASGKTTLLNAISMFIRPEAKIISIEDTPELKLPHPNWIAQLTRQGFGSQHYGEVDMFDLLRAALRQRPDYIIVGEVRGKEASILFQAMATGHTGLATIHADNMEALIDRLTTPPINLPPSLLENLNAIVFPARLRYKNQFVRRVKYIYEIKGYDRKEQELKTLISAYWDPLKDTYHMRKSILLGKLTELLNIDEDTLKKELILRAKILKWLKDHDIVKYRDF
ncbi:MAG: type II/IV secretion system ATPase subunit, partial [Nanoarchaeota archaeon]